MSIAGYLNRPGPERVTKGEQICELLEETKPPKKSEEKAKVYEAMQDCDPVLRSHCRLVGHAVDDQVAPGEKSIYFRL